MNQYIFDNILKSIFYQDDDKFKNYIIKNPELLEYCDNWCLVHYLFQEDWQEGINIYIDHGGRLDLKTKDKIMSLNGIPLFITGGQTLLHIIAKNNPEYLDASINKYSKLNVSDNNNNFPRDLLNESHSDYIKQFNQTATRCCLNLNQYDLIDINITEKRNENFFKFTITDEFNNTLKKLVNCIDNNIPNSMHRTGKIILPEMTNEIYSLTKSILPEYYKKKILSIFAFYVKYDNYQNKLDSHKDDSTITINLCLSNKATGGDIVFDKDNIIINHNNKSGILHMGCIKHHVNELRDGTRENIIIWVKCF